MASELVKRALRGEEKALVLLTEQIQIGTISVESLGDISTIPIGANQYADYLKACIYHWGANVGEFNIPENRYQAVEICMRLIEDKKLPWANNLMYVMSPTYDDYRKYILPVVDRDNPLVIMNYALTELFDVNKIDLFTRIYSRLSPYYQNQINESIRETVKNRSTEFKVLWTNIYHFYKKTNQLEAAENFLVLAAVNNIHAARMKLSKRYSTKSSAEEFCSGYLSVLAVINRRLTESLKYLDQQYPLVTNGGSVSRERLLPMLEGLQTVVERGAANLVPGSREYQQYQLCNRFYNFICMVDYIYAKQDEWEIFKNYLRDHQGISSKKLEQEIAKVDVRFEEFIQLKLKYLAKMKAVAVTQFNFALYSQTELNRIQLRLLVENFAKMKAIWDSQEEQKSLPTIADSEQALVTSIVDF